MRNGIPTTSPDQNLTGATIHQLTAPGGRALSVRDAGPAAGRPVVLCHPAPGSSDFDPDPAAGAAADVRLIAPDRPGYGGSDPVDGVPSIISAAADVITALDHLGIDEAALVGWSAGGRVALAAAALHPDRVSALVTVGTPAPQEEVPWIPEEQLGLIELLRPDPATASARIAEMFGPLLANPAALPALLCGGPEDEQLLAADSQLAERLSTMLGRAVTQGAAGIAADLVSYTIAPWDFEPAAVQVPTLHVSGAADLVAPPAHGGWYAEQISGAEHRVIPAAGHLVVAPAWAGILQWLGAAD